MSFAWPALRRPASTLGVPRFAALALALALAACAPAPAAAPALSAPVPAAPSPGPLGTPRASSPPGPIRHVVVVTIDGLLPETYRAPDAHGLAVPNLRSLVARGASSDGALSVYPTLTYPAHTSIASGVTPARHGIVSNLEFDPLDRNQDAWRWYDEEVTAPRIWDVARDAGYSTALIDWPVTVGEAASFHVPEVWRTRTREDLKLIRALSTPGLLEQVAAEFPDFTQRFDPDHIEDEAGTDIAIHLLGKARPHLLFLHIWRVDAAQHESGLWSEPARAAIENADGQLGRLLEVVERAGIAAETAFVIASDHGFASVQRCVNPNVLLRDAGLLALDAQGRPRDWQASALVSAASAYIYLSRPGDVALQAATRRVFEAALGKGKSGIGRIFDASQIRERGGDPAAFLALEPELGTTFGKSRNDYETPPGVKATHGYSPERPEMLASLILFGPNVPHGTLPGARLIDVAPTVAEWLGLELAPVDGHALVVAR